MTERLKNSIEALYETFQRYLSNSNMNGSPVYGHLNEWNKELFSKPLRELDEDDLSRFAAKAITTWGNTNDYKHFLPRIFEAILQIAPESIPPLKFSAIGTSDTNLRSIALISSFFVLEI